MKFYLFEEILSKIKSQFNREGRKEGAEDAEPTIYIALLELIKIITANINLLKAKS